MDADVLCHQFAYLNTTAISFDGETTLESLNPEKARIGVESMIMRLRERLKADEVIIALTDRESNFRKLLDPAYKSKRSPKPTLWYELRDFLEREELGFQKMVLPRLEGDDVLGILATGEFKGRSVMVSIDKDMQTIPGLLFNPAKDTAVRRITETDAAYFHALQTLTGDPTDGYIGCRGCGPVKAAEALQGLTDPAALWRAVLSVYQQKKQTEKDAIHQARLAYILRAGDYDMRTNRIKLWKPPSNSTSSTPASASDGSSSA